MLRDVTNHLLGGRYRLLAVIGRGGMSAVYEAVDCTTDRLRAVKLISAGEGREAWERFEREARIAGRVESPHIVEIVDAGHDDALGALYLVMDRLRGENLGERLAREHRLAGPEVLDLLGQVGAGLDALHAESIVHRDVKPENIFLVQEAGKTLAKVVDLGLAKSFGITSPRTTRALGTPLFMSPEQLRGDAEIDHRSDIYAFGQLAFTLLVGTPYHACGGARPDNLYALLLTIVDGPREPASARARASGVMLAPEFDAWFARATHSEPASRFASCAEAVASLGPFLMGSQAPLAHTATRDPANKSSPPAPAGRRYGGRRAIGLALSLLAVIAFAWRAPLREHKANAAPRDEPTGVTTIAEIASEAPAPPPLLDVSASPVSPPGVVAAPVLLPIRPQAAHTEPRHQPPRKPPPSTALPYDPLDSP